MGNDREKPALTTDVAAVTGAGTARKLLLIQRGNDPFTGRWALPGGFLEPRERLEHCARRELREETGLEVDRLELLGVYDTPGRDPRGWIISVVYVASVDDETSVQGADDAADARWFALDALPELAFDHELVVADLRAKLSG